MSEMRLRKLLFFGLVAIVGLLEIGNGLLGLLFTPFLEYSSTRDSYIISSVYFFSGLLYGVLLLVVAKKIVSLGVGFFLFLVLIIINIFSYIMLADLFNLRLH